MATTRHHDLAPHQHRGGGIPKDNQKAGADAKNRRALGDIGNLITARVTIDGKPLPQISRPITRNFRPQLQENAQATAAAAAASKKPVAVAVDGAAGKGCAKETKQKVSIKQEPNAVIEISPDTDEKSMQTCPSRFSSSGRKCSKKKVDTLTSVLTTRSKSACGVADKLKDLVLDIDASDVGDQLAATEYVEDIYKFYKLIENTSRPSDYMDSQVEINAKMRAILADWLIEVHNKFELMPETLYLTFYIIDRYLSTEMVLRRELQLVGVSAMLIASKYEEIWAPEVNDFVCISDRTYTREQILAMEKKILNRLEWSLTVPTPYVFLVRFIKAAASDKEMEHMTFFFAELGLMQYSMVMYSPSMFAASAVYAARCTLKKSPLWTETLKHHTGFSEQQLLDCLQILVECHSAAPESKLKVVYKKYSSPQLGSVALQPPATKLVEELKAAKKTT